MYISNLADGQRDKVVENVRQKRRELVHGERVRYLNMYIYINTCVCVCIYMYLYIYMSTWPMDSVAR